MTERISEAVNLSQITDGRGIVFASQPSPREAGRGDTYLVRVWDAELGLMFHARPDGAIEYGENYTPEATEKVILNAMRVYYPESVPEGMHIVHSLLDVGFIS